MSAWWLLLIVPFAFYGGFVFANDQWVRHIAKHYTRNPRTKPSPYRNPTSTHITPEVDDRDE